MSNYAWFCLKNITIIVSTAVLFYLTRSAWCFLLLLTVSEYHSAGKDDEG